MKTSFSNDKKSLRFWWIFLFSGGLLLTLGVSHWLLFRSLEVIGRAFELKQWGMMHGEYLLFFGIAGFVFSWITISSPLFATTVTVTWTGIALLTAGIFYLYFSLLIKTTIRKIQSHKTSSI